MSQPAKELTPKQRQALEAIQAAVRQDGRSPTYEELAAELGVTVRAAFQRVEALERKGYVHRSRSHRGIELADEVRPEPGLPVVGRVAAGAPILAVENIDEWIVPPGFSGEADVFALAVQGDSMVGRGIHDGDYVIVRMQRQIRDGEVGVFVIGDEATVKTARYRAPGGGGRGKELELHPENPRYPVTRTSELREDVHLAGRVVGVYRRM